MTTTVAIEPVAFSIPNLLEAMIRRLHTFHARRAYRLAVMPLLEMDAGLLDDMGLSTRDVRYALNAAGRASDSLHARRRINALRWTPKATAA